MLVGANPAKNIITNVAMLKLAKEQRRKQISRGEPLIHQDTGDDSNNNKMPQQA